MTDAGAHHRVTNDHGLDDPNVGVDVPMCVRRGGATGPAKERELSENGTAYIDHSVTMECKDCGATCRFATSSFATSHRCHECEDVRMFIFRWELNRPDRCRRDVTPVYTWCNPDAVPISGGPP